MEVVGRVARREAVRLRAVGFLETDVGNVTASEKR